jgi:hypothetical protein
MTDAWDLVDEEESQSQVERDATAITNGGNGQSRPAESARNPSPTA